MSKKVTRKDVVVLVLGVLIVVFVVNFLSSRHFVRVDLTEKNIHTLSDSTKKILWGLGDVVNITVYFSKDLPPAVLRVKKEVDDILSEYRTYAGGKLHVKYVDPQETPQIEYQVQAMGIPPVQVNVIEKDKQEVAKLYLGITVMHEDRREIIPVVQSTRNLEYDLTSAIVVVSMKDKPGVAWLSDQEVDRYKGVKGLLEKRYNVRDIKLDEMELSQEKNSLLIVTLAGDLSESQLSLIEGYLSGGGKIFLMVDRVDIGPNLQVTAVEDKNVLDWLLKYGIEVKDRLVLDRVSAHAAFSGGYVTYHVPYPYWVKVTADGFDSKSPVVSDLDLLILPWTSPVEISSEKKEDVRYELLAKSSPYNAAVELDASLLPETSQGRASKTPIEPKPLVVMMSQDSGGQMVVVGNSRFVEDRFVGQFGVNTVFFENVVDFMAMGSELIGIRSKGFTDRPIEEISPSGITFVKYVNILGPPFALLVIGAIILFLRRQRREFLKNVYGGKPS